VEIEKPVSVKKDFKCKGTVNDIDGDLMKVDWEITNGHFAEGTCGMKSNGDVCEVIITKDKLNVGERIKCKMTPSDGELAGVSKEATVAVQS
jgi:hypothetical protein